MSDPEKRTSIKNKLKKHIFFLLTKETLWHFYDSVESWRSTAWLGFLMTFTLQSILTPSSSGAKKCCFLWLCWHPWCWDASSENQHPLVWFLVCVFFFIKAHQTPAVKFSLVCSRCWAGSKLKVAHVWALWSVVWVKRGFLHHTVVGVMLKKALGLCC